MRNGYGPWATSIDAGSNPQLSTFWRRRLTRLVPTSKSSPVLSRRSLAWLLAAGAMILVLPTFRAVPAALAPEEKPPEKSDTVGKAVAKPDSAKADSRSVDGGETLSRKLHTLDQMRNGRNTPLDTVESRGKELLAEYTSPEQQGQVYYQLAHIQGQSGLVHPELVIEHAKHALQLPIRPVQRLRLYTYWGDALRVQNRGKIPFADIRRLAAVPYLEGLKDAGKYHIPEERPKMPLGMFYNVPEDDPSYKEIRKKAEEASAAQQRVRKEQELWFCRKVLVGQVVEIYSRKPHAATELRQLATRILEDPEAVGRLMKLIGEKGALEDDPAEK